MTKYNCEYGKFTFVATAKQIAAFSSAILLLYLALCVGSVFLFTLLIESFIA